jgi:hypothetical protein
MATSPNATQIIPPRVPIIDERTGAVSREWYRWFYSLYNITGGGLGAIPVSGGGTGLSTIPANGQLLIGNGSGYSLNTLGTGAGISVLNDIGTITIANTGVLSFSTGTTGLTPAAAASGAVILGGILAAKNGGTGFDSYAIGDLLYADTVTSLAKLPDVATGNALISGGVSTAPLWGKIGLTTHVSGVLPIANGGTNGSATPTAYGVAYGTGTTYAFTAAGTAKQVLIANTSAAPTWSTLTSGSSILYGDGSGGFSNVTIGTGVSFVAGTLSATGSGGTVTSVTGTSPVVSSGGATPAISLAAAYGDTLNPYGTKTANYVLAGPTTGATAVPTFRALVAADIPSLPYGTGTVTSVATAGTVSGITLTGGPITTTGTVTLGGTLSVLPSNFASQTANTFLAAPNGSAGTPTFRAVVAADVPGSALTKTDDTNVTLTLGGSPTTALLNAASLTLGWTGQLSISRGGTNTSTAPSAYGVVYGNSGGTAYTSLTNGTTGQILTATTSGAPSWAAPAYTGTVTSVSFTGGIITVATGTTTPAFTVAGTSGGIPYFSSGTTWASSAALTQYGIVYGGGAGASPVATAAGTTGQVLTATTGGAPTWVTPASGGSVTSVSVVSANGFAGTVATATTTPAITLTTSITGVLKGNGTAISAAVANTDYVPLSTVITKTADYTITNTDTWIINNKTGSALTLTFPAASSWTGRYITVKNMQAQAVNSASSNIVPIDSTTAGTAILLNVVGNWATMVSDGTNWVIMQAASNNNLLLE